MLGFGGRWGSDLRPGCVLAWLALAWFCQRCPHSLRAFRATGFCFNCTSEAERRDQTQPARHLFVHSPLAFGRWPRACTHAKRPSWPAPRPRCHRIPIRGQNEPKAVIGRGRPTLHKVIGRGSVTLHNAIGRRPTLHKAPYSSWICIKCRVGRPGQFNKT